MLESLHTKHPNAQIDILVRKGNDALFYGHPFLNAVLVWEKNQNRYANLWKLAKCIRKEKYNAVFNAHRFASSGLLTMFSGSKVKSGFAKNPFSFSFTHEWKHEFDGKHETERNQQLLSPIVSGMTVSKPELYPRPADYDKVKAYKVNSYRCMAPTSVWYTKQWPKEKWIELCDSLPEGDSIYLLGAPSDKDICHNISASSKHPQIKNLAGELTLLQSAALMEDAIQNYVNDSAPMHLASSVNARITAIYCSTIPKFGFGPLSDDSKIVETSKSLDCRPCGVHGHKACPMGHFDCSKIEISEVA